jgi:hypothetical protein
MANVTPPYKHAPEGRDYSVTLTSGAMTIVAAAGPVWSCRWTVNNELCVVKRITLSMGATVAFTTAQWLAFGLFRATAWTVADSGGTAATLTTYNGQHDTKYIPSVMGDMRIGTTGVITAGTRTVDAQPLVVSSPWATTAVVGSANYWDFVFSYDDAAQPLILRQNEGLILQNQLVMGAAGVVRLHVSLQWDEVASSVVK